MTEFMSIFSVTVETLGRPRVFGLDEQTMWGIIAQLANIIILAVVLSKILYNPVKEFMRKRTERVLGEINSAKEERAAAEALRLEYEEKMRLVGKQCDEILEKARKDAEDSSKRIVSDAKKEADELLVRAKQNIALEEERVKEEVRLQIIHVSAAMTERFLVRDINKSDHERLFDETMAELEGLEWRN